MSISNKFKKLINILKKEGFHFLLKKFNTMINQYVKILLKFFLKIVPVSINEKIISRVGRQCSLKNSEEAFSYIEKYFFGIFAPMQIKEEFLELLNVVSENRPKVIMEIGTANGGTLFCFSKLAPEDAIIISIDLPGGEFGGGYEIWRIPFFNQFKKSDQKLYLLREDSHTLGSFEKLKAILNNNRIDFLFIDGDHSYEGVKKDFEMYSPLVREKGIIAFHDIAPNGKENKAGGVPKFWKEIKNNYSYKEYIKNQDQIAFGIGCIFL